MANENARTIRKLPEPSAISASAQTAALRLFGFWERRPRLAVIALAAVGAVGLAVVYLVDPRVQGVYPICPFFGITGFHCPGCGTLRALHTLMRGDVAAAFGYNAMAMLALPFIAYSGARSALAAFGLPAPPPASIPHRWIWALLAGAVGFWALRNVPIPPFAALAP